MKKNNKGFTLVELLAVMVIIGFLAVFAIPQITGMLSKSRDKIYISDAKKMIAQTEYKLKSQNTNIEIPDPGDCIAVSLVYLDSNDFDTPPNDGEYLRENSFVIVKNTGNSLEYSVTLVELTKKKGYKGVELISSTVLSSRDAFRHIVNFKKQDLINVENDVTKMYINDKLGEDYITSEGQVTAIYNYPDLIDSSTQETIDSNPRIIQATISSASNSEYQTLDSILKIKAEDADTPRKNLKVLVSMIGFEVSPETYDYGTANLFTKNYNFGNYNCTDGEKCGYDRDSSIHLYITVKDSDGNKDQKELTYEIHRNQPPVIDSDKSSVRGRPEDSVNMITARVALTVTDDIDTVSNLNVCFAEAASMDGAETCTDYQKYSKVFGAKNTVDYQFKNCNGGVCIRDGSIHYLTVFVKDNFDAVSTKTFEYYFSNNEPPSISSLKIVSKEETFTKTGSRNITVTFVSKDDIDSANNLKVEIGEEGTTNKQSYNYSSNSASNVFQYVIDPNNNTVYDGSTKRIYVKVTDAEGASNILTSNYILYNNLAPTIKKFTVSSDGAACSDESLCPTSKGGSKKTIVNLTLVDDMGNLNSSQVCITTNSSECNDYVSYSNFNNKNYKKTFNFDYDGSTKTIYAFVKDSYGSVSKSSTTYKVYKDSAPIIKGFTVTSNSETFTQNGSLNTKIKIDAVDDFDLANNMVLSLKEDSVDKIVNANLSSYNGKSVNYIINGDYDGEKRSLVLTIKDSKGQVSSKTVDYQVYKNQAPKIESFNLASDGYACKNQSMCPTTVSGNYVAKYSIGISDDIDIADNYKNVLVCVSENKDDCSNNANYKSYSNYYDSSKKAPKELKYTFSVNSTLPYNGANTARKLYVYLKDTLGSVATSSKDYTIYTNQAPVVQTPTVKTTTNTFKVNIADVTFKVEAIDDLDTSLQAKYCYILNKKTTCMDHYVPYTQSYQLTNDNFFKISDYSGQTYSIFAYIKDSYGAETKTNNVTYELYSDSEPIIDSLKVTYDRTIYKNSSGNVVNNVTPENASNYNIYQVMKVTFKVRDYFDTYHICINDKNSCTSYLTTSYDGSNTNSYTVTYEHLDTKSTPDVDIYLYLKDSHNNIVYDTFHVNAHTECERLDPNNKRYEYKFLPSKTYKDSSGNTVTDNAKITMNRCNGKCYNHSNIIAYYDRVITYYDLLDSTVLCSNQSKTTDYRTDCSFIECFNKNGNYNHPAIGLTLVPDSAVWTVTDENGNTIENTSHYQLYESSYETYDEAVTLTKLKTKISPTLLANGTYDYDNNSSDPYLRVQDPS